MKRREYGLSAASVFTLGSGDCTDYIEDDPPNLPEFFNAYDVAAEPGIERVAIRTHQRVAGSKVFSRLFGV
ncbi:hypothetical protein [Halovivax gelatinilyticus]|uniref:hypothetical protein n=1 Tax=Halovivax gelatinilyticus TaxID=2961597 RepID=UPI0020CA5D35|nr:hypothetical protein [Halovivax gelatinilyticus]